MSVRVVLQEYLASMKERHELDVLLPELLSAMGHEVLSKPQVGVRQGGVDCLSSAEEDGEKRAFLFIIKFGDIGRSDFYGSPQAIEPSVHEACSDYILTKIPANLKPHQKRLVVVTNGELKQEVQQSWASLTKYVATHEGCALQLWNAGTLVLLVEQYLLDETLLLETGKQHLRKAVAGLDEPEFAVRHFLAFVDAALAMDDAGKSQKATNAIFDKRCRAAIAGWVVFKTWCQSEDNLKPALIGGEYLLLRLWAAALAAQCEGRPDFSERFTGTARLYVTLAFDYYNKIGDQLVDPHALLRYAPEHPLYAELVFDELGRLGSLGLLLTRLGEANAPEGDALAALGNLIVKVANAHPGCQLPALDGQAIDISLILTALAFSGRADDAVKMAANIASRLALALRTGQYLPISSDSMEDLYAVRFYQTAEAVEYFKTTTLVPMLATFAAAVRDQPLLDKLREEVVAKLKEDVTLERWFPTVDLERQWGPGLRGSSPGRSRALSGLGATVDEEAKRSTSLIEGAAAPADFRCTQAGCEWLLAMSARHFRHPLPPWYFFLGSQAAE